MKKLFLAFLLLPSLAMAQSMGATQGLANTNTSGGGTTGSSAAPTGCSVSLGVLTCAGFVTTGVIILGTGPTTLTDVAGKVLSASLNTVGVAQGGTNLTAATDDRVMVGNGTTWQSKAMPDCPDTGGNHLNYDASTNTFSCGTS